MICFCITILILLLLIIISVLLIKRNKQNNKKNNHNNIYKLLEGFTAFIDDSNKVINVGKASAPSSELIGKNGVLQTLPHCNDLKPGSKYPDCCTQTDLKNGNCYRLFPKNPNLKRTADGKGWQKAAGRDDNKYIYNPLYPYARTDFRTNPGYPLKYIYALMKYFFDPEITTLNLPRIDSVTIPDKDKNPINITDNSLHIIKNYMKLLTFGKDKSPTEPCNMITGKNCIPIGTNRWQKVGKCPNKPNKDMYAYIDIENKNNPLNMLYPNNITNGLSSNVIKDILTIGLGVVPKLMHTIFSNSKCQKTTSDGKTIEYVPFISDPPFSDPNYK